MQKQNEKKKIDFKSQKNSFSMGNTQTLNFPSPKKKSKPMSPQKHSHQPLTVHSESLKIGQIQPAKTPPGEETDRSSKKVSRDFTPPLQTNDKLLKGGKSKF